MNFLGGPDAFLSRAAHPPGKRQNPPFQECVLYRVFFQADDVRITSFLERAEGPGLGPGRGASCGDRARRGP